MNNFLYICKKMDYEKDRDYNARNMASNPSFYSEI